MIEAWKKLLLVGFAVLVLRGTIEQLVIAFMLALLHMLLISTTQPFKQQDDDYFAKACSFALTALLFFCIILKVGALAEAVEGVLTRQLRARFGFDAGLVAIGMSASIAGSLLLAALMAARELLAAARQLVSNGPLAAVSTGPQTPHLSRPRAQGPLTQPGAPPQQHAFLRWRLAARSSVRSK